MRAGLVSSRGAGLPREGRSMTGYRLVLIGTAPAVDLSGYVFCADDAQARAAAQALLQFHPDRIAVRAYEGERLICEMLRDEIIAARSADEDGHSGDDASGR